jgi:hypothetical protein
LEQFATTTVAASEPTTLLTAVAASASASHAASTALMSGLAWADSMLQSHPELLELGAVDVNGVVITALYGYCAI